MRCRQVPDYAPDLGSSIGKSRRAGSDKSESVIGSLTPQSGPHGQPARRREARESEREAKHARMIAAVREALREKVGPK